MRQIEDVGTLWQPEELAVIYQLQFKEGHPDIWNIFKISEFFNPDTLDPDRIHVRPTKKEVGFCQTKEFRAAARDRAVSRSEQRRIDGLRLFNENKDRVDRFLKLAESVVGVPDFKGARTCRDDAKINARRAIPIALKRYFKMDNHQLGLTLFRYSGEEGEVRIPQQQLYQYAYTDKRRPAMVQGVETAELIMAEARRLGI